MKKVLSFVLCVLLVAGLCVSVSADEYKVTYRFGEIEGEAIPGEVITVPLYLKVVGYEPTVVNIRISFDSEKFEFQKYKKSSDLGDHNLEMAFVDVAEADPSLIGALFTSGNGNDTQAFDDTLLVSLRFKVKDDAVKGEASFDIANSEVANVAFSEKNEPIRVFEYESEAAKIFVDGADPEEVTENDEDSDTDVVEDETDRSDDVEEPDEEEDIADEEESEVKDSGEITTTEKDKDKDKDKETVEPQPAAPEFTDLAGYEWAKDYIVPLAQKGIIKGTSETTFAPSNNIIRADFMVLLMRLLEINRKVDDGFVDVPADAYFANAVANAKKMGIAKGGTDGKFNPYNPITREDLCVLVYRALVAKGYLPVVPDDGLFETKFTDTADISDYAYDAMHELYLNEIIGGSDGKVNPKGYATRAETAVIMFRISKLIPEI